MNISEGDIDKYREVSEKNKQLIIKKNVLNQLLKGTQSEAIRMVLDKVASGKLKDVTEDQIQFVEMLQENNYDINKIIDVYVKKLNDEVDGRSKNADRAAKKQEQFSNFSKGLKGKTVAPEGSTKYRAVDDTSLPDKRDDKFPRELTASDYTSQQESQDKRADAAAKPDTPSTAAVVGDQLTKEPGAFGGLLEQL